jgi:hypothetical protein
MFAIVDVVNRGGKYSLGTIVSTHKRKPTISKIASTAISRAELMNDRNGSIPCVGVKLKEKEGSFYDPGLIIDENNCDDIFGDEKSIQSIYDEALSYFDKNQLIAKAHQQGVGRPAQLENAKRYNVVLDEHTVQKAQKIGNGNLSEGLRLAVKACDDQTPTADG